jgi:hypothetical protein
MANRLDIYPDASDESGGLVWQSDSRKRRIHDKEKTIKSTYVWEWTGGTPGAHIVVAEGTTPTPRHQQPKWIHKGKSKRNIQRNLQWGYYHKHNTKRRFHLASMGLENVHIVQSMISKTVEKRNVRR